MKLFDWLFGKKKKTEIKVSQDVNVSGNRNQVVQTTNVVNQRGAKATGDIVGGNKYAIRQESVIYPAVDPVWDLMNPTSHLSPLNQSDYKPRTHSHSHNHHSCDSRSSHSHSHDSGSSYHSHDSLSASPYDPGPSYDSSSSSSYSSSD